jgi:integrase
MQEINRENGILTGRVTEITFAEFAERQWRHFLGNRPKKESTLYSYDTMLRTHFLPALGEKELAKINRSDIADFMGGLATKGLSSRYRLCMYTVLRMMFEVAVEYEMIEVSPIRRKIHRPEVNATKKPALSAEEVKTVLDHVAPEYWTLCAMVAVTAMRIGELLALRWMDLDFDNCTLAVNHTLWRKMLCEPKTRGSRKRYQLPETVFDLLKKHRESSKWTEPIDYVFCREDGEPFGQDFLRRKVLYPAIEAAGIKREHWTHGFHLLRHSGASILYSRTRDLKLVQTQLRHSKIATTSDIYVHLDDSISGEATELLARELIPEFCGPVVALTSDKVQ